MHSTTLPSLQMFEMVVALYQTVYVKTILAGILTNMKKMGIDFGTKNVGIAMSDEGGGFAFPREVLLNDGLILGKLSDLIKSEQVDTVVLGWSVDRFGGDNAIMGAARKLADKLKNEAGVSVVFQDESFSSVEAERFLNYGKPTTKTMRQKKVKKELDASAAAIILQRYLDKQR